MRTNYLMYYILFALIALFSSSCKQQGCTSLAASNYDADAEKDDGSCCIKVVEKNNKEVIYSDTLIKNQLNLMDSLLSVVLPGNSAEKGIVAYTLSQTNTSYVGQQCASEACNTELQIKNLTNIPFTITYLLTFIINDQDRWIYRGEQFLKANETLDVGSIGKRCETLSDMEIIPSDVKVVEN